MPRTTVFTPFLAVVPADASETAALVPAPATYPLVVVAPAAEEREEPAGMGVVRLRDAGRTAEPAANSVAALLGDASEPEADPGMRLFLVGGARQGLKSIIMPSDSSDPELDAEDDSFGLGEQTFGESRSRQLVISAVTALSRRRTPVIAVAALAAAVLLVVFGPRPQTGSETDATALSAAVPGTQAGPQAMLPLDSNPAVRSANGTLERPAVEADPPVSSGDRNRAPELSNNKTTRPVPPATNNGGLAAPALPTLGDFSSRAIPTSVNAQLDSVMRTGAAAQLTVGDLAAKPTFASSPRLGSDDGAGSRVMKAALIGNIPRPPFPDALRSAARDVEGEVVFEFTVDTTGRADLSTVTVVRSSHELFTAAALKALPALRFFPAQQGNRKVRGDVQVPFRFSIYREDR
jgi:TonB family protein